MYGDGVYVGVLVFWFLGCFSKFLIFCSKLIFELCLYNLLKILYNFFFFRLLYRFKKLDKIFCGDCFWFKLLRLNFFCFRIFVNKFSCFL